ncbi:MAG: hypothetical protein IPH13_20435 [Planctomycetes bacterium]|nr:hypothetical protein [Planctomycetota bacterium]
MPVLNVSDETLNAHFTVFGDLAPHQEWARAGDEGCGGGLGLSIALGFSGDGDGFGGGLFGDGHGIGSTQGRVDGPAEIGGELCLFG